MTKVLQLPKSIKRITVIQTSGEQAGAALTVYRSDSKRKKKKQSRGLRLFERWARRNARANVTFSDVYLDRHDRSNRKRRDGWLRDMGTNVFRANRKASKKLRMRRMLPGF